MKYPINLELDTNGQYLVTFPDIPEAVTAADKKDEISSMALDALESALDFYFDQKRHIPIPSALAGDQLFVDVPATVIAKVMLHNEMLTKGIKKAELARRMKMAPPNVERIFNARHGTKFETLEQAFAALGKRIEITVR